MLPKASVVRASWAQPYRFIRIPDHCFKSCDKVDGFAQWKVSEMKNKGGEEVIEASDSK